MPIRSMFLSADAFNGKIYITGYQTNRVAIYAPDTDTYDWVRLQMPDDSMCKSFAVGWNSFYIIHDSATLELDAD